MSCCKPESVHYDDTYTEKFVQPALVAISAARSGVTSLVPRFNERVTAALVDGF